MAQDQLRKPQPTRGSRGGAFAYRCTHLPHAEPQFTRLSRSRHPLAPQGSTRPFAVENSRGMSAIATKKQRDVSRFGFAGVPTLISAAGERASFRLVEFFTQTSGIRTPGLPTAGRSGSSATGARNAGFGLRI